MQHIKITFKKSSINIFQITFSNKMTTIDNPTVIFKFSIKKQMSIE